MLHIFPFIKIHKTNSSMMITRGEGLPTITTKLKHSTVNSSDFMLFTFFFFIFSLLYVL